MAVAWQRPGGGGDLQQQQQLVEPQSFISPPRTLMRECGRHNKLSR